MFTSVLALDRLGPDWQFRTEVLRDGAGRRRRHAEGQPRILRGDGDPSLSRRWVPARHGYDAPMRLLAERVAAAGVKRVTGDLIADATAFESRTIPEGWLIALRRRRLRRAVLRAVAEREHRRRRDVPRRPRAARAGDDRACRVENAVARARAAAARRCACTAPPTATSSRAAPSARKRPRARLQLVVGDPATFTAGAFRAALASQGITVDGELRAGRRARGRRRVATHRVAAARAS